MDTEGHFFQEDEDDYVPPPRQGLHTEPELCKAILRTVTASVPLSIRSSTISPGSGLFVDSTIENGREIYHSEPLMSAIDAGNNSFCHFCLKDTSTIVGVSSDKQSEAKACMGCRVARFCSKKCQKDAWVKFHKDECAVLKNEPNIKAQDLLVHRVIFWQQRKGITTTQGKVIEMLENHFWDYSQDGERNGQILDMAMAVRQATGGKVDSGLTWRLIPAFQTNCIRLRPASNKNSVGAALDLVTTTINHSCEPNAFAFFEGNQLKVRSLKRIAAGAEITICYVDPTIDTVRRQKLLKLDHFFDCSCSRCKGETKEYKMLLKTKSRIDAFHQAQREILELMSTAVQAAKYPSLYPAFAKAGAVETQLRTIIQRAFPESSWPDDIEPLPSARLSIADLHLATEKLGPALRSALRGKLMSRRRSGPDFVNEMMDVVYILLGFGNLPPDAPVFEDKALPHPTDLCTVTCGYLYEACKEAGKAFGGDSQYTKGICDILAGVLAKKPGDKPGSEGFAKEFETAQGALTDWAAIPASYRLVL
ncbi:hypothetical protein V8F20_011015 [Naviculisporaceae sp. PSN 640]